MKTYNEGIRLETFKDRYEYFKLSGLVGSETFGSKRYLNQAFYSSKLWRDTRNLVIIRDNGCDLGIPERKIFGKIYIHHINPITIDLLENHEELLLDLNNLICVSYDTHAAIHYGDYSLLPADPIIRKPNDTCPWKGGSL